MRDYLITAIFSILTAVVLGSYVFSTLHVLLGQALKVMP